MERGTVRVQAKVCTARRLRDANGVGMLRVVRRLVPIGCWVLAVASGCAYGEVRQVVRAQFASDVDCGDVQVEKKGLHYAPDEGNEERYKVTGCGVERTYTCPKDAGLVSYGDATCTWVLGDSDRPQAAETKPEGVADPFAEDGAGGDSPSEGAEPTSDEEPAGKSKAGKGAKKR
jgi:hypothetical protein